MAGQSRKWMILIATTWLQAFSGTNFDFSSYSSSLKSVLGISQLQLNYLSVASDMGKAFGWCSGVSLRYLPLSLVMFMAAFLGLFGYTIQWLVIQQIITIPYFLVFLLCLLAGCSITWFNTVCFVLCIRNFPTNKALSLSLTTSYNGVSAALYTLIANAINPDSSAIYLLLNGLVPLFTSGLALIPILRQPPSQPSSTGTRRRDRVIFIVLYIIAVVTGIYLLLLNPLSSKASAARILLVGAIILLVLPLCLPGIVYARDWARRTIQKTFNFNPSDYNLIDTDELELELELHKDLMPSEDHENNLQEHGSSCCLINSEGIFGKVMEKDRLTMLGEEHPARLLVRRSDFWLYYMAYFCGGTIGLVYSNNLGQIAQSLGYYSKVSSLVTLYSSCSFFGRLLSSAPEFLRNKVYFARTGWLALALVPTPIAFLVLSVSGSEAALQAGTGMVGLSSGFVISAAVTITSELFGPNNLSVNHNILITNIPIGSLLFGNLAALIYDYNAESSIRVNALETAMVCMGRKCYLATFMCWGFISLLGLVSSFVLFVRTKPAYDRFERNRRRTQFS